MIAYKKPVVTAEVGCNHNGDFDQAMQLIRLAAQCKVDFVKFQKRNPRALLSKDKYNAPHPDAHHAFGQSYGAHREFLELDADQHASLQSYAHGFGVSYAVSVWDEHSAAEMIALSPAYIKIPSACNNNKSLLEIIFADFMGPVHISLGMTTMEEEALIIRIAERFKVMDRLVLYACTSAYPCAFDDVHLLEITRLRQLYRDRVKAIGYSGHHLGIAIDNAAYTLGAEWIERHFTIDRTMKGTDHAASLEVPGLQKLVRDLNATYASLTLKAKPVLDVELNTRSKLKYDKI